MSFSPQSLQPIRTTTPYIPRPLFPPFHKMSNQSPSRTKANPPHLSRVHAAAVDGRVRNPIFRRTQLKRLHDAVASNSDALERAILADALLPSCITPADARLELCLALRAVRELAAALDVKAAFAEEYSVASSKDAAEARRPVGIVVVTPAAHTPVYSAVAAVAAAVAGGNCVILQVGASPESYYDVACGTEFFTNTG